MDRRLPRWTYWLRLKVPIFREERLLGASAIFLRAVLQLAALLLTAPNARSWANARACLRAIPRHTMIAPKLLFRMMDLARGVHERGTPGAVVECGVWNGGSLALLSLAAGGNREAWGFDSFSGVPLPTERDPVVVRDHYYRGWNLGSVARVRQVWRRLRLPAERLRIVPGWFEDTFVETQIEAIAILHVDSDWYDSVLASLNRWYHHVQTGGIVIINDYGVYAGATQAVADFFSKRETPPEIHLLGSVGAYFHKEAYRPMG